jgi:hypothetical protein
MLNNGARHLLRLNNWRSFTTSFRQIKTCAFQSSIQRYQGCCTNYLSTSANGGRGSIDSTIPKCPSCGGHLTLDKSGFLITDIGNEQRSRYHCVYCMKTFSQAKPKQLMSATTLDIAPPKAIVESVLERAIENKAEWLKRGIPQRGSVSSLRDTTAKQEPFEGAEGILSLSPNNIYDEMEKWVIGQEQVKKVLSVGMYNHYQRLRYLYKKKQFETKNMKGSNIGNHLNRSKRDGQRDEEHV